MTDTTHERNTITDASAGYANAPARKHSLVPGTRSAATVCWTGVALVLEGSSRHCAANPTERGPVTTDKPGCRARPRQACSTELVLNA